MTRIEVWVHRYDSMESHWNNLWDWCSDSGRRPAEMIDYIRDEWSARVVCHKDGLVSHLEFETEESATLYLLRWA